MRRGGRQNACGRWAWKMLRILPHCSMTQAKPLPRSRSILAAGDHSARGQVIHSFQGCRYLMEQFHEETDPVRTGVMASELLAFAIGAHHGLFDCVDPARRIGLKYRAEKQGISYEESVQGLFSQGISKQEIERLFSSAVGEIDPILEQLEREYVDDHEYFFVVGLLARLLLSAVIEGDRYDTAAFMEGNTPPNLPEDMTPVWAARLAYLEEKLQGKPHDGEIDNARQKISETCGAFAEKASGIYRLNVPTGGGKTLSSLRYALAHAKQFGKKRLIFTSPLLSILEQNAKEIRKFVGDDRLILEHHSNVVQTDTSQDALDECELLVQSWNAPIILTTLVQLLNTLFDGKTTSIRRFQALCDSVIVIDEVQTVPTKLLSLFNLAIQFLSEQCRATVVLCSATQPCVERAEHPLRRAPEEIVPYDEALWATFRRTELQLAGGRRLDELPEMICTLMENHRQPAGRVQQKERGGVSAGAHPLGRISELPFVGGDVYAAPARCTGRSTGCARAERKGPLHCHTGYGGGGGHFLWRGPAAGRRNGQHHAGCRTVQPRPENPKRRARSML